jgi:hypothetical protein
MSGFFGPASLAGGGFVQPPSGATGWAAVTSEIIGRYEADNPAQTTVTIDVTFAPSDINTGTDKVTLVGTGLLNVTDKPSYNRLTMGTPVFYQNTGGTPPTGLTNGQMVYLDKVTGNDFYVYPTPGVNDYQNTPWALSTEPVLAGQNYAQAVNKINFSDQGSGTHRFYSNPLLAVIKDMGTNLFDCYANDTDNRHTFCEVETDSDGYPRFLGRLHARDLLPNYTIQGKAFPEGTGQADYIAARAKFYGRRSVACVYHVSPELIQTRCYTKSQIVAANISGSSITATNNRFVTADLVNFEAREGTLPVEFTGDKYVRKSGNTLTIHPTAADASANTNVITPTKLGTEGFIIIGPSVADDYTHWNVMSLIYGPDSGTDFNVMAPRLQLYGPAANGRLQLSGRVSMSGATNGQLWTNLNSSTPNFENGQKVYLWVPERCVMPNKNASDDGGAAMASGYYYTSREPANSGRIRLHYTLAQALASVGITAQSLATSTDATKANATAQCIKYQTTTLVGTCLFEYGDDLAHYSTNTRLETAVKNFATTTQAELTHGTAKRVSLGFYADFNDPNETYPVMRIYKNGVLVETYEFTAAVKGNLTSDQSDNLGLTKAFLLLGDNEPHGPMHGGIYGTGILASTNGRIPDSDFSNIYSEWNAKWPVAP